MKKVLLYILGAVLMMIVWRVVAFLGTVDGWFHQPIAKHNTSQSFRAAIKNEIDKQFVGNFAMATLKDGIVEYERFHSAGKPVDRNTVFQVSSLSKWISDESSNFSLAEFYNSDSTKSKHYKYTSLAATSLYTSLFDLELFIQAHLEGKNKETIGRNILKPKTIKMMREPHGQSIGIDIWGLGTVLYATTNDNDFIIGHDSKSTPPINTAIRLNPETGDGIIILEMGHPTIATKLASEWVFWKNRKVDTFLFPMLIDGLVWTIGIGWAVIISIIIIFGIVRRLQSITS